ncbi:unnamed protein product [Fraxinus pennsylvanica]|uniref:RING-type E3 ubiquitin transferase n=1 Tax=Fraxinus pennsylvanica TaxID=56036 RepID=A0AAD2E999_9LAMI|nr:unnamed protein product [Fraxinus pennsylvanica]
MGSEIYRTRSESIRWWASIGQRQITERVGINPYSATCVLLNFNFQTIKRWVNYSDEVLMEDVGRLTSLFTWVDFGAVYDDLKQTLLSRLPDCGPDHYFKEDVVKIIISNGHDVLACADEKIMVDICMTKFVTHSVDETSLGLNDGPNMTPASMEAILSLPEEEVDYKDNSNKVESCMVCLEEIEKGLVVSTLPCSHIFHSFCISEWLKRSHYCPLCRFEMPIA